MSTQTPTQSRESCKYCGETYQRYHRPGYCSIECYARGMRYQERERQRQTGRELLEEIRGDHRYCSSCFCKQKDLEKPPREGFLDYTNGVYEQTQDDGVTYSWYSQEESESAIIGFQYPTPGSVSGQYGLECSCGNVQHSHDQPLLRDPQPYHWHLNLLLSEYEAEGRIESYEFAGLMDAWYRSGSLPLALGNAVDT